MIKFFVKHKVRFLEIVILTIAMLSMAGYFFNRHYKQARLYNMLQTEESVLTTAWVVQCQKQSASSRTVHYRYEAVDSNGNEQEYAGSMELESQCKVGDPVEIRYLVADPQLHLPEGNLVHSYLVFGVGTLFLFAYFLYKLLVGPES